jgi:hypothetical protein
VTSIKCHELSPAVSTFDPMSFFHDDEDTDLQMYRTVMFLFYSQNILVKVILKYESNSEFVFISASVMV